MIRTRVLIAGVSVRAAAESAAAAGFDVTAIDAFGDLDQHPSVQILPPIRRATPAAMARAVRNVACDAVAYLSAFENHPRAVTILTSGRALWGNAPEVLTRVRDPMVVAHALQSRGFETPQIRLMPDATTGEDARSAALKGPPYDSTFEGEKGRWLLKPLKSGGGRGVRFWQEGDEIPRNHYLQQFVAGAPGSVVFVAAGRRAVPLGVLRQLIGEETFGATGFRYCGNILAPAGDARDAALAEAACALANAATEEFRLVGLNGIDFVARYGRPVAVEINPRWCASLELVEHAYGLSAFALHAAACDSGTLPAFDLAAARRAAREALGKAVIFARRDVTIGDPRSWLEGRDTEGRAIIRDIPHPGERIAAGFPVCTIFAAGLNARACHDALVERAELVHARLAGWGTEKRML